METFDDYYGYNFDDPSKNFYANDEVVYEGNTDENGQINFQPDISIKSNAPVCLEQTLKHVFLRKVEILVQIITL